MAPAASAGKKTPRALPPNRLQNERRIEARVLGPQHCVQGQRIPASLIVHPVDQWDQIDLRLT